MPAKPYRELRESMSPESQQRAKAKADKLIAEIEQEINLRFPDQTIETVFRSQATSS